MCDQVCCNVNHAEWNQRVVLILDEKTDCQFWCQSQSGNWETQQAGTVYGTSENGPREKIHTNAYNKHCFSNTTDWTLRCTCLKLYPTCWNTQTRRGHRCCKRSTDRWQPLLLCILLVVLARQRMLSRCTHCAIICTKLYLESLINFLQWLPGRE